MAYPTTIASFSQTEFKKASNLASSTAAANYSSSATAIAVNNASNLTVWPSDNFVIYNQDTDELIFCSSRSGNNLTVVRNHGGNGAAAITSGDTLSVVWDAATYEHMCNEIINIETALGTNFDATDFFDKTVDDTDDITESATRLFFTTAEQAKLAGIEAGATADQTAADIRGLGFFDVTNDGTGSGLDADTVDGIEAAAFLRSDTADNAAGIITFDNGLKTDTISEDTPDTGVTIDGLLIKDGEADLSTVAKQLKSATTDVDISASAAPTVGQVLTAINSTSASWQTFGATSQSVTPNSQTGTTYTVVNDDNGKLISFNNASDIAVTLPDAAGTGFDNGWYAFVQNTGVGTVTITPTTSTIDGAATLVLTTDQGALIASDGTNYFSERGTGGLDIDGLDLDASPGSDDFIVFYDTTEGVNNKAAPGDISPLIDHDVTTNFVADEHIAHSGVDITAGAGLTGGGDITATRTLDVGAGTGITVNANDVAVDQSFSPTWTGTHDFTGATITVPTPTASSQATTKDYVDGLVEGLKGKGLVVAVSDSNIASLSGTTTIDSVSVVAEDVVLLTGQTTASENGSWVVKAGAWVRPDNFDVGVSASTAFWLCDEGTNYADTRWWCTNNVGSDVVDTDNLTIVRFSGAAEITAGSGLSKSGNTVDLDFPGLTAETTPVTGDLLAIYDTVGTAHKKLDWEDATTPAVPAEETGAFTIGDAEHNSVIRASGTFTITLDHSAGSDPPRTGFNCVIINTGTGTLTFSSTDTINSVDAAVTHLTQYGQIGAFYDGAEWYISGQLE